MSEDVEESCTLLQMPHLDSCNANLPVAQHTSSSFISSNMSIEDTCIYTAAVPTDLAANFPEGSVLQIMPDSAIVAVAVKNENSVAFKDSSFSIESASNSLNLPNLLTGSNQNNESQSTDVPICSEENIDIDLSFLNEAEENTAIPDSKCLDENSVKELPCELSDVSSQSIDLLQNNLSSTENNLKPSQESETSTESSKDSNDPPTDVVMIDVTKPIQLSQNSLITVNGQKCVLQQDPQTGQVIAYPVKELEKPRRKRGRPRKTSIEQNSKEMEQAENKTIRDVESLSEEEREKGLLEVVNDDGSLVRRSSRKRRKAKVLKDYETGNLKQELGSDVDDVEASEKDAESYNRKKKSRGPGRPRKFAKIATIDPETDFNNGIKRQRGRPKKAILENEPTQAFLVQTADGQTLMMQVPLSSIPPGVSLQEMAQEIANKLNLGLNQANDDTSQPDAKDSCTKEQSDDSMEDSVVNASEIIGPEIVIQDSEPALQVHSIGSTTNFTGVQAELNDADENSCIANSSCQDIINMNHIIDDAVCGSEEVILESGSCVKDAVPDIVIPDSVCENQNNLNVLEVPQCSEDNFCINMPATTTSIDSTSMYCNFEHLNDHNFCMPKSNVSGTLKENIQQVQPSETSKIPKDLFTKSDILKNKTNFQLVLQADNDSESQNIIQEFLNKNSNSENSSEFVLNTSKLTDLIINQKNTDKPYLMEQIPTADCSMEVAKTILDSAVLEAKDIPNSNCLQTQRVLENTECSDAITSEYLNSSKSTGSVISDKSSEFIKLDVLNSEIQTFEVVVPIEKISSSLESSVSNEKTLTSSATVIPVEKKALPILLDAQIITGSKQCKICQMPYLTDEEIIAHFKAKHPRCICTECNYMNEHPYVIKRHAFRHTNHGCICKICNKKYKDLYILKMHIKMVHLPPDVLFCCEICEKKFTRKAHLKRHLRIHAPVKQYQCPHCDYKGCEKSDITKHLLIHEEPKFKCEICGKAFRHVKNKELHLKRHSGQRDYKCAACGFFGYTYTDIRKHIERRHSGSGSQNKHVLADDEFPKENKNIELCQPHVLENKKDVTVQESPNITITNTGTTVYDEVPLDILETEQPQVMTIGECSEETLSALQNGHLIMTNLEGVLNTQNAHLIVESLENNNAPPDNLSVISLEKDSNETITLVTTDGKSVSFPLKNCSSLPLESLMLTAEGSINEPYIPNETEVTS